MYWNGAFRFKNCHLCCKRWYFTFNGAECNKPLAIDGIAYIWKGKNAEDIHRVHHIEGHCLGHVKGDVRIGFWVGNCHGMGNADAYTGWNSVSRIYVAEVPAPQP